MSIRGLVDAFDSDLPPLERLVAIVIGDEAGGDAGDEVEIDVSHVSVRTGIPERDVRRILISFRERDILFPVTLDDVEGLDLSSVKRKRSA